jgi:hypothetical protein
LWCYGRPELEARVERLAEEIHTSKSDVVGLCIRVGLPMLEPLFGVGPVDETLYSRVFKALRETAEDVAKK